MKENKEEQKHYCKYCGAPAFYSNKKKSYTEYCLSCKGKYIKEKREQTMMEKYGVKNPSNLPSRKEVMKRINEERKRKFASGELVPFFKGKTKETNESLRRASEKISKKKKEKYKSGEIEVWNKGLTKENSEIVKSIGEKVSKRKKGKKPTEKEYEHILEISKNIKGMKHSKERIEKTKKTTMERYGFGSYLSIAYKEGLETIKEKYNGFFPESEEFKKRSEEIFSKMKKTNMEKYGFEYAVQNKEVFEKILKTKKENGTSNSSKEEKDSIDLLLEKRKEVWAQHKTKDYPFFCDVYLPKDDLYIEFNYHWTHNDHPFNEDNPEDIISLKEWIEKSKKSDFYKVAIDVWTFRDPKKISYFKKNSLNYKIFYSKNQFKEFLKELDSDILKFNKDKLRYFYEEKTIIEEFKKFLKKNLSYKTNKKNTNLVLPFVWRIFYQHELKKWENQKIRNKLIQNRISYLHKKEEDLKDNELLSGFSKSGIYKGYSSFSPYIMKSFIRDYNISSIYDPFGGWGQRLLGAWNIRYHYNDYNPFLVPKIKELYDFYSNIEKGNLKTFSCKDASTFIPNEKFGAVLTCPPYYNTEDYNFEGDSKNLVDNYDEWINEWWRGVIKSCKRISPIFAYVVSEKYKNDMNRVIEEEGLQLIEKHLVSSGRKNHLNSSAKEFLYIYK